MSKISFTPKELKIIKSQLEDLSHGLWSNACDEVRGGKKSKKVLAKLKKSPEFTLLVKFDMADGEWLNGLSDATEEIEKDPESHRVGNPFGD